ncbi:MAG: hypothetical protein QN131_02845 [Armatimonadota bacterium]|nr:hypothetical protein [Armatimonadota bacterium]MDR7548859.1 hypothetical protein [Armatimonadota bacterium]
MTKTTANPMASSATIDASIHVLHFCLTTPSDVAGSPAMTS